MLRLYNSLSRQIEDFKPINPPHVTMYACGPTVYQFSHIGNFRSYFTADILVRALKHSNFDLKYVMNITDVGHLTGDQMGGGDTGEDKIEQAARKENKTAREVADYYTDAFVRDSKSLNLVEPDISPRASSHISEQIQLIEQLEKKGFTYTLNDGVYFNTARFPDYGKMSSLDKSNNSSGFERIDSNSQKKSPRDFALWKLSPVSNSTSAQRLMEWDSPWGIGFPGWHIECSAMSLRYLTEAFSSKGNLALNNKKNYTIDIHTGGVDHKEIHHPNEIVQSECATGQKFVNYWIHTAFMLVAGQKMSKSLGNTYTLYDLEKENYDPLSLRYLYLQTHYRQEMNFTFAALDAAAKALKKLQADIVALGLPEGGAAEFEDRFFEAVYDDLNMPKALAVVWELIKSDNPPAAKAASIFKMDEILGLDLEKGSARLSLEKQIVPPEVRALLKERKILRSERKFNQADNVRKQINDLGYEIQDTEKGTKVKKI